MSEEIPKQGKAGVVVNEGSDFKIEVQMVDVPEPSRSSALLTRLHHCPPSCRPEPVLTILDRRG